MLLVGIYIRNKMHGLLITLLLTLTLTVVTTNVMDSDEQPFTTSDEITVAQVLRRYPYLRPNLHPDVMHSLIDQIPEPLRAKMQMVKVEVAPGVGNYHCYGPCLQADLLAAFLKNRFYSHGLAEMMFVMYVRDELHDRTINEYLDSANVNDQEERAQLL